MNGGDRIVDNRQENIEEKQTRMLLSAIVKGIVVISLAITMILWGYSCQLSPETIQECRSACNAEGSQMSSVTNRECRCEKTQNNAWVIPRSKSTTPVLTPP